MPTTVVGTARAINAAVGFSASTTQLTSLFAGLPTAAAGLAGYNRIVVNRSSRFFVTLQGTLSSANAALGSVAVHLPIPPLGMCFLPCTFGGTVTVVANSTSTLPAAPTPVAPVPRAGTNVIAIEILMEQ